MKKSTERLAIGTAIAAAAGYVAGILTAPKSGKNTRIDIQSASAKKRSEAEHKLKSLHSELSELIDLSRESVDKLQTKASTRVKSTIDSAQVAKDKAREMLSAVHEGGAEDEDLHHAILEVKKATTHLKKYLKNEKPAKKTKEA